MVIRVLWQIMLSQAGSIEGEREIRRARVGYVLRKSHFQVNTVPRFALLEKLSQIFLEVDIIL